MIRFTTAAIVSLLIAAPAMASTNFTATLKAPKADSARIVAYDVVWLCADTTCEASINRKKATVSVCKKVVKQIGEVAAFASENNALSEEELSKCNASLN